MVRILLFLLLVLGLGFGFAWFADRPGEVSLEWQGTAYETSLMVLLVAVVALIAAVMIAWWLLKSVLDSPKILGRFWRRRKRERGFDALTSGLIAANAGDAAAARKYTKESGKLLGETPLVGLLDAQTALLEGNRDGAKEKFESMLENDRTRLVALRGLYVEAERQGASQAARHYAEEAHKASPTLTWAGNAKLKYATRDGDWEGALATLEANRSAGLITKAQAKRQRAVLLTAQAMAEEPADPGKAAKLAKEAHRLAPELVPAAVIGAKALMRNNDIARAAGMVEKVWKKTPHPELAQAYVNLRFGDSAQDRLKRAKKLASMKAHHTESNFAVAEAAIDAKEWSLARQTLKSILSTQPTERACLLMAEVEEAEFGDEGRMRDWLSRAVRAPKDPAWTADGYVSEKWLPFSPVTGQIDAFEWKTPVEQLGGPQAMSIDADAFEAPMKPAETAAVGSATAAGGVAAATAAASVRKADTDTDGSIVEAGAAPNADPSVDPSADPNAGPGPSAANGEDVVDAEVIEPTAQPATGVDAANINEATDMSGDAPAEVSEDEAKTDATSADAKSADEAAGVPDNEIAPQAAVDEPKAAKSEAKAENADAKDNDDVSGADAETSGTPSAQSVDAQSADYAGDGDDEEEEQTAEILSFGRSPDDPGVEENKEEAPKKKRFGIF